MVNTNLIDTETSYSYDDGEPFTEYAVTVDGLVERNGVTGRVVALAETIVETEEDGKWVGTMSLQNDLIVSQDYICVIE